MLDVIKIIDLDYNNSGAYVEYYKKARTGQVISEDEQGVLELEGVTFNVVNTVILHED